MHNLRRFLALVIASLLLVSAVAAQAAPAPNKRPASVHLKPPAAKMPATRKDARPPARRDSLVSVTRPNVPAQATPPREVQRRDSTGNRPSLVRRVSSGSIRLFKQASLRSLGGRAFASMKSIFIAKTPTDTRHIPHEAWHVVQR